MDKNKFISVLDHFSECSVKEAEEVLSLRKQYPYSQILHVLSAKVSKDHGFSNQQEALQLAAIYASDRAVLKEVMNAAYNSAHAVAEVKESFVKAVDTKNVETVAQPKDKSSKIILSRKPVASEIDSIDLADAVMLDLEQLNKSRHDFETMFDGSIEHRHEIVRSKADEAVHLVHQQVEAIAAKQEMSGKTKKERIVELARALEAERASEGDEPVSSNKKTGDTLIDEIVNTKTVITPETEKQKKQIEIIDQL